MSTSKPPQQPGGGNPAPSSYTRFIPREELGNFAAWSPAAFEQAPVDPGVGDVGARKPTLAERAAAEVLNRKANAAQHADIGKVLREAGTAAKGQPAAAPKAAAAPRAAQPAQAGQPAPASRPGATPGGARPAMPGATSAAAAKPAPRRNVIGGVPGEAHAPEPVVEPPPPPPRPGEALRRDARPAADQEGYRNGLAALESYKQTQSAQMAAYMSDQIGLLASDFHQRLEALEQQLAGRIAGVALELARQVVRADLVVQPETVVAVAEEVLGTLLASARQVVLRLHPDDHALAQAQLTEVLVARGVRVVPDVNLTRGGCLVESDIAVVDATVEARWDRAAASLGHSAPWNDGHEAQGDTSVSTLAERIEAMEDAHADDMALGAEEEPRA
jgi:flagellar assembly protein FliH